MRPKRQKKSTENIVVKRSTRKRPKKDDEIERMEAQPLSLPIISEEKHYCDEHMPTFASLEDKKVPRVVIPKIKIRCVPLNVEKILDFENHKVYVKQINKAKELEVKEKAVGTRRRGRKPKNWNAEVLPAKDKPVKKKKTKQETAKKVSVSKLRPSRPKKKINNSTEEIKNYFPISKFQLNCQEDLPFNDRPSLCKKDDVTNDTNDVDSIHISSNLNNESSGDIRNEIIKAPETPDCPHYSDTDELSDFLQFNNVNLQELTLTFEDVTNEMTEVKGIDNLFENRENTVTDSSTDPNISLGSLDSNYSRRSDPEKGPNNLVTQNKTFLQAAVENFITNCQVKCSKETSTLKKGLCSTWLSNNFVCPNQQCHQSHCAIKLFTKKMKSYSSKYILSIVVCMRQDVLFVDAIMAALKVLASRKIPSVWITFLTFFVFYVTEPSDSRFLKFWANAARFYSQLSNKYTATNGYASLLSIFSKAEKSEEWKIIEFIKLIQKPPIQVGVSYELLQPVLKIDLPPQFFIEAVKSCINCQKDVLNVYESIIPKISFTTSSIQEVELLLEFCQTLQEMDFKAEAYDLKVRLEEKVKSFKTRIVHHDYPLTAAVQEGTFVKESDRSIDFQSSVVTNTNLKTVTVNVENNYFQLEDEFCCLMIQTVGLMCTASPGAGNVDSLMNVVNNGTEEKSICNRQIARIKQFFDNCQFDLLGKYLNDLRSTILEQAAEEFLKLLFQMKISLQQVVDLIKTILLNCKSDSAAKVCASICISLILNLVKISEWRKAYTLVSLCQEKQINLLEGKIFFFNGVHVLSQCRIALLLIEINANGKNFSTANELLKTHFLYSPNNSLWKLEWKWSDESIRVKILENFLRQVINEELTDIASDLFFNIRKEQNKLNGIVDLRIFINEILILLLNQGNEKALSLYEKINNEVSLNSITVRAILVTLVRHNRFSAGKEILFSTKQNAYSLPKVVCGAVTMAISNSWLEEEIFMVFDAFLEFVAAKKRSADPSDCEISEINVQLSKPSEISAPRVRPLCLGIIKPSFEAACCRIQRVLQYQFNPPLKLIVTPCYVKVDEYSLKAHLYNRICGQITQ